MKTKTISQNTSCRCGVSKYMYNCILQIMMLACSLSLASCSESDDGSSGSNIPQENKDMLGSKWSLVAWDYSLGDEYVGLHKETYQIYFNSLDRGFIYYGKKDWYSDEGSSTDRRVSHFKYIKKGNKITLSYICDIPVLPIYSLGISGNRISPNGSMEDLQFAKETISSDDNKWINTILGKTGSCMWFSDLVATLWIDGEGNMADYSSYSSTPWAKNDRTPNNVVIGEGVTSIGAYSFANVSIASVQMPDKSLKKVGDGAFSGSLITRADLGDNVTYIGQEAFAGCEYLRYIDIPANILTIGDWAFANCKKISATTLEFPKTLRSIGNYAFYNAGAGEIRFEEGVETIGNAAFLLFSAKNTELTLPNSLQSLGATAFMGKFSKITIGNGLEKIDKVAFISSSSAGEMYVNRSTPPSVNDYVIGDMKSWSSMENKWTLYVPIGCKKLYQATSPWNNFKSIVEDASLSENGDDEGDENEGNEDNEDVDEYDRIQDEADTNSPLRGHVASDFAGGTGTSSDPYRISNAAELRFFSDAVRGGRIFKNQYIVLTDDIVINRNVLTRYGELNGDGSNFEPWIPIGRHNPSYFFCGTFDGCGHTISGLYCNRPNGAYIGLFGYSFGDVKNIKMEDSYFSGLSLVAGIVGQAGISTYIGSTIPSSIKEYYMNNNKKEITISHCYSSSRVETEIQGGGGIVGRGTNVNIKECYNGGYISGNVKIGGIVGSVSGFIYSCYNNGYVRGMKIGDVNTNVGGIVGYALGASVYNCLNKGDVKASGKNVGGIAGCLSHSNNYILTNSVNINTNIEGTKSVGSIIGCNSKVIVKNNYFLFSEGLPACGESVGFGTTSGNRSLTEFEMKSDEILSKLNASGKKWCSWKTGSDGYPILSWVNE